MTHADDTDITIFDESGIFGLADVARYTTFVDPDWKLEQLIKHFRQQSRSLAVWYGGDSGMSTTIIRVRQGITEETGFREATTSITVSGGILNLVSYDALTMAAQFDDESLPAKSEAAFTVKVPNGDYDVRIVQMYDPDDTADFDESPEGSPAFLVELEEGGTESEEAIIWLPES